jgi:hypothetical protein
LLYERPSFRQLLSGSATLREIPSTFIDDLLGAGGLQSPSTLVAASERMTVKPEIGFLPRDAMGRISLLERQSQTDGHNARDR